MTVHPSPDEAASAILHFWFEELSPAQHWLKSPDMDRHIADRFGTVRARVLAEGAAGWRETPDTLLAAIILLDQFSRNIFRGTARAFEGDSLALELAKLALEKEWIEQVPSDRRPFLLMPLMHSERIEDQERSVAEFGKFGEPQNLRFAILHRDQIQHFGRFPGRNEALCRDSTPEERRVIERGETF